jgi:hypothetical protein
MQKLTLIIIIGPILLGLQPGDVKTEAASPSSSWESLPRHKDEDQVQLDVNRAFIYYPDSMPSSFLTHPLPLLSR